MPTGIGQENWLSLDWQEEEGMTESRVPLAEDGGWKGGKVVRQVREVARPVVEGPANDEKTIESTLSRRARGGSTTMSKLLV